MMNAKTNHEYTSNTYNGGIMTSESPAALLDMLAEVASQTLHSEKKHSKSLLATQCKTKTDCVKRRPGESSFNVPQLLSMPASQLVKQFSVFTSDELKRQYSYTCALIVGCGQKYTSFASEGRARMSIKAHLAEHLEYLKTNKEAYKTFTAKSISSKNYKAGPQNKRNKLQQSRKPQETLNKENTNVITEKSSNYLRNILLSDSTFKELDKNKNVEKVESPKKLQNSEQKDAGKIDFKVLGDHSYFEPLKDETPSKKETTFNDMLENTTNENIVLMVVGTDTIHMREYPNINKTLSEKVNYTSEAIYLPELSCSTESNDKTGDTAIPKPKGKAKFIGTSKEEREMALAFMERIKKKGNPTGGNLECRICNPPRSFTAPTTLVSHYRSHAGIKPYECRICRAVFTRRHSLKYHMLIHQNQTRFTCADCGKKFRHPSHFREHRRRHTGEAPFGCDDCGQRFKTRNTYKRHLKTRHGKVLTTTGELLHLSEEDFQKVRTNKKKKNDTNKDHMIDESVIATKTIMHYEDNNEQLQNTVEGEYIINDDDDDDDDAAAGEKDWVLNGTRQIVKNCFETYEICPESHPDKTEFVQTETSIDDKISTKHENYLSDEYGNEIHGKIPLLQDAACNKLEVVENNAIINYDSTAAHEVIYHNINEAPSYIHVEYNNLIKAVEDGSNLELQENFRLQPEHRIKNHIQVIHDGEEDYINNLLNNSVDEQINYVHDLKDSQTKLVQVSNNNMETDDINKRMIFTQKDTRHEKTNGDITIFDYDSPQEIKADEITVSEGLIIANTSQKVTNKILSTVTIVNNNEDCPLEEHKKIGNYQTVITKLLKNQCSNDYGFQKEKLQNQPEQYFYIRNDPLTSIVVQNKCINILPQRLKNDPQRESEMQLNKNDKFILLNKHMQAINIKQNGNQSTILLLTKDALRNNIFKIDQHDTAENKITN